MKTIILIGASGKMGQAASSGLTRHKLVTASKSGKGCDHKVDITNKDSIRALYKAVGEFDAVINAAGHCEYAPFETMNDAQWASSIAGKLMGQINVVNVGLEYIRDGGSFTLISGINSIKPMPQFIADSTTSGAIDTFVKSVAFELPRGIRINAINPTILEESWDLYKDMLQGFQPVPGKLVGKAFERSVEGFITGQVIYVDA